MLNDLKEIRGFLYSAASHKYTCAGSFHVEADEALSKLDAVIEKINSEDFQNALMLAISEHHSGSENEGRRIVEAAINVIKGE